MAVGENPHFRSASGLQTSTYQLVLLLRKFSQNCIYNLLHTKPQTPKYCSGIIFFRSFVCHVRQFFGTFHVWTSDARFTPEPCQFGPEPRTWFQFTEPRTQFQQMYCLWDPQMVPFWPALATFGHFWQCFPQVPLLWCSLVRCYTFGAPRVGNAQFAMAYNLSVPGQTLAWQRWCSPTPTPVGEWLGCLFFFGVTLWLLWDPIFQ